ncbi:MAG: UDP-glucose 4-epimerase [Solirubrobacterales bacterium]|jgi:UDP-glucose 4-epimerase|nr:UDP-glucose 4-epimerase [Solirubrobacterales bacterium]
MPSPRRVVIIGVSSRWGTELALRLERDPGIEYVAGIDNVPPAVELGRTDFIEADIRSPLLARLLPGTEPEVVVHCGVLWYPERGKPARSLHDVNVIGTLQLLAACERAAGLRRIVVRGSAAIYGCEGAAPSFFTEDLARRLPLRTRFQRDASELEEYFDTFAARHPQVSCCMLRYQPELGADLDTPITRYLTLPVVPVQLGFDPRLQFIHSEDATAALEAAVRSDVRGAVNVAPTGAVSLIRALRLARRPSFPLPHPLFGPALARLGRQLGTGALYGDAVRMLRYGRGVDTRRLREEVGFVPRFDAEATIRDFAAQTASLRIAPPLHLGSIAGRVLGVGR